MGILIKYIDTIVIYKMDSKLINTWVLCAIDELKDIQLYRSVESIFDQEVKTVYNFKSDGTFTRLTPSKKKDLIAVSKGEFKINNDKLNFYFSNSYLDFSVQILELETDMMKIKI